MRPAGLRTGLSVSREEQRLANPTRPGCSSTSGTGTGLRSSDAQVFAYEDLLSSSSCEGEVSSSDGEGQGDF